MYRIHLQTNIAAPPARVWRALCDPNQVVLWDRGATSALDAPPDYPQPGQRVRWRYRSRLFPTLLDQPQEVIEGQKLRSLLRLGPYEMDETYTLIPSSTGCRLDVSIDLRVAIPILGGLIERLYAGPDTRRGFAASVQALQRYCEEAN